MGLSPSTLFHFTSKRGLFGILNDNFKIKYCSEQIDHNSKPVRIAIPMVSFCDIRISEISEHIEKYGHYGLGLSKEWGVRSNLNPVIYMNKESNLCSNSLSSIRHLNENENVDLIDYLNIANLVRYMKIYEGNLNRNGKTVEKYRFADEREWRFVPDIEDSLTPLFNPWLEIEDYKSKEQKEFENLKLKDLRLKFDANNILYIIVKDEKEIDEVLNHIRRVKGGKYTMTEVDRLTTRIISCERIMNDF